LKYEGLVVAKVGEMRFVYLAQAGAGVDTGAPGLVARQGL
jgi:hypothetical protein